MKKHIVYKTEGVCASKIEFDLEDGRVYHVPVSYTHLLDGRGPGAPSALIRVRKLEKRILQRRLRRCFYGIFFCFGERPADGKGKGSHRIRQKFRDNR